MRGTKHLKPHCRESLIPGINEEAPLRELHEEILGITEILSPQAEQIIEEVERNVLASKVVQVHSDTEEETETCNVSTPKGSGNKKKKAQGKSSGSQRKKHR